ncbi:MAG: hypothetical protein QOG34_589 [Frankiaceae bacterium]|nr:hypothetical protein [Frankiaceae bacterium]
MTRWLLLAASFLGLAVPAASASSGCGDLTTSMCGVSADQAHGDFHGLIMVRDQPDVLDRAANAGTTPGCGDCVWEIILACPTNLAGAPDAAACGAASAAPRCRPGQQLYRLYLTTRATTNKLEGALCLGDIADVIAVGNIAAADVARYLRDVTPPPMTINTSPPTGTLVGLPTYFKTRPPANLAPAPFGGPDVHETITLAPSAYDWNWGDGESSGWITDPGDTYPRGTVTHTYATGTIARGTLTTRWGGSYTITVAGRTFGPYNAIGTVTRTQPYTLTVFTARSQLVSHP